MSPIKTLKKAPKCDTSRTGITRFKLCITECYIQCDTLTANDECLEMRDKYEFDDLGNISMPFVEAK